MDVIGQMFSGGKHSLKPLPAGARCRFTLPYFPYLTFGVHYRCFGSMYGASRSAGAARRLARAVDASGNGPGRLATLRHDLRTPLSAIEGLARPARASPSRLAIFGA
jgi:hypothetical protein